MWLALSIWILINVFSLLGHWLVIQTTVDFYKKFGLIGIFIPTIVLVIIGTVWSLAEFVFGKFIEIEIKFKK
jgi:hypothetical protein